jgi:hypothetical protein
MKKSILLLITVLFTSALYAQVPPASPNRAAGQRNALPPPLVSRQISGIVKDTTDTTVPGAVIRLTSAHDTMSTASNPDGIFVFKNVKMNIFTISVNSLGYRPYVKKFTMNDAVPRLTLDPVILKSLTTNLKEVVVNGTPSIVYKVDTIEYKASDYKVRPNATLDELLKKMEGFEVGSDGSVTHQGQAITKVKLNGKDYAGGDVAQAIQNLPADIIEKAQVVDDYGDQAARSGIKDGDPQKILNVTTKADRSVGTTGRLIGQVGNDDRYNTQLFIQRINANQQIGVIANFREFVTGVQSTGAASTSNNGGAQGGGNPGTTQSFAPTLSYQDQYGPKVRIVSSATYGFTKNNSYSQKYGLQYLNSPTAAGPQVFNNNGNYQNNSYKRSASFEMDYSIDSLNYLQITPTYSYSTAENSNTSSNDNISHYYTTTSKTSPIYIVHQVTTGTSSSQSPSTQFGLTALFNHRFRTPQRNFSAQISYNRNESQSNGQNVSDTRNYADSTTNALQGNGNNNVISDRPANLITNRINNTNTVRGSMTYSEPLGKITRLEFNSQITNNSHYTKSVTDSILTNGTTKETDLLYNYATTETRLSLNYRYNGTKVNLSLGATATPYYLSGTRLNNNIGANVTTTKNDFRILPIFRFAYQWSRTQRFTLSYSGAYVEPAFQYIQPFTDYTDPNNIIVGNPDLRVALNHNVNIAYNNYFPNSRFNLSFNGVGSLHTAQITTNVVQGFVPIPGSSSTRIVDTTHYINLSGSYNVGGNYNISKQLADRRYNLALNGTINYGYNVSENFNTVYHQTSWEFNERFGPRITPTDNIEVNPFIGTDLNRSFATTTSGTTFTKSLKNSLGIDGRFYFFKTYQVHYDASKQLISQTILQNGVAPSSVPPINNSPLVIDAGFQKEIGQKRQFTVTFDVFDLLHQNSFLTQSVSATGVTNTVSSSKSRYFLVGFRLNLQKWSGKPQRNGRDMQRRGDGSFIYN